MTLLFTQTVMAPMLDTCCFCQVDDVLKEDAEKARSLEEVIAELERLQTSEREKDSELTETQALLQVWGLDLPMLYTTQINTL